MNLEAVYAFFKTIVGPLLMFINKVIDEWTAFKSREAGALKKEEEVRKNEDAVNDALTGIDPSKLPDDEAFKPRQP